jgi:hypothetical protein
MKTIVFFFLKGWLALIVLGTAALVIGYVAHRRRAEKED